MREEITMISSDENRKVIISKYTYDGCSIKMYSNGFCQMELLTYEDLFQLSKKQLRIRHCIQFVNRFLEEARSDSGKYDNASSLSGGFGDRVQGPKTIG